MSTAAAYLALGAIWGSSFLFIKIGVRDLPPATLVAYRLTVGAVGMAAMLAILRLPLPPLRQLAPFAVLGLVNTALPFMLLTAGETHIDSGTTSVLNATVPLFSLVIAGLWLHDERITLLRVGGLVLGFAGAALLASREFGAAGGDPLALVGALLVVAAAVSYAFGVSFARRRIREVKPQVAAALGVFFATLYSWPVALVTDGLRVPASLDTVVSIVWLGLLGSFVAYLLYFFLIGRLGATRAATTGYLFPVVGVTLGVVGLGESVDWRLAAGLVMVLGGIVLANLRSRTAAPTAVTASASGTATAR
jgi:drug/metabolite transporter (DMT)-like permease